MIRLFIQEPKRIIRSSETVQFENGTSFEILMTNPVQQGCVMTSERTRLLVVDVSTDDDETDPVPSIRRSSSLELNLTATPPHVMEPKEFHVTLLQKPWPEARLYPAPDTLNDDASRIFIDIQDLAKCGVFSGDWVLVSANDPKKSRLCRVYGIDDIPQ